MTCAQTGLLTRRPSPLATADEAFKARPSLASLSPEGLPVSGAGPAWGSAEPPLSNGSHRAEPDCKYLPGRDVGASPEASSWAAQVGACQEGWGGEVP